jgi:DNA helicase-2/ATP-dependent DNA helicase PcrA
LKKFLRDLNKEQLTAATTLSGPVLILAGAGSGKTKTIISRTVNIISSGLANPNNILILTFTNKAAREMRDRGVKMLIDYGYWHGEEPNFSTFHAWGVRFLKTMNENILLNYGVDKKFNIAEDSDKKAIVKKIILNHFSKGEIDKIKIDKILSLFDLFQNSLIPYMEKGGALSFIESYVEENGESVIEEVFGCFLTPKIINSLANLFINYKQELRNNNMLDFDDIINIPIYILRNNSHIKNYLREYYKYIMVDEFQDTNYSQLILLNLLLGEHENICVVGDDSQSIYGWRGAKIDFILNFHNERKNTVRINLKTNYRSTKKIVKKANKLLRFSNERHEFKEDLEAFSSKKGIVKCSFFRDPSEEVSFVIKNIVKMRYSYGIPYGEMAILYRSNHLNRRFEVELIANNIPYKIHNGKSLLERKAALDILSYIKFLSNPKNKLSFSKVLLSAKILSEKRLMEFENEASKNGEDLITYIRSGEYDIKGFGKNSKEKVLSFVREIDYFLKIKSSLEKDSINNNGISYLDFMEEFFKKNCISKIHKININKKNNGESISDNLYNNAVSSMRIIDMVKDLSMKFESIESFLEVIALEGEVEDTDSSKVNLMTVHASKGLEFGNVFLVGFSQGIFPSKKNLYGKFLEEERRLAYVAITRAKDNLFVSGASYYFGNGVPMGLSQFATEAEIK